MSPNPVAPHGAREPWAATRRRLAAGPWLSEAGAPSLHRDCRRRRAAPKLVFLTAAEYAAVDALAETIIPADDHSPGAHAARVADYIDLLLSESDAPTKDSLGGRTRALDQASTERFKAPFAGAGGAQQVELLTELSRNEMAPQTPAEKFFGDQGLDHPRLLHVGDRHPQGSPLQGQPIPRRVRRLHHAELG